MTIIKKRHLYLAGPAGNAGAKRWKVTCNGEIRGHFDTQNEAIQAAATTCRSRWANFGDLSELKIMGRNGKIRDSRSYGKDPRKTPG